MSGVQPQCHAIHTTCRALFRQHTIFGVPVEQKIFFLQVSDVIFLHCLS